jgi:hypothetical protein
LLDLIANQQFFILGLLLTKFQALHLSVFLHLLYLSNTAAGRKLSPNQAALSILAPKQAVQKLEADLPGQILPFLQFWASK